MTVLDLINYLETLDETMDVVVWDGMGYSPADERDFHYNGNLIRLEVS